MSYGDISSSISSGVSSIKSGSSGISASNFNGFWSGGAHDNLTSKLASAMSNLNTQLSLLSSFSGALSKLQDYKTAKEKIEANNIEISKLNKVDDASKISSLQSENDTLKTKMANLKASIESVVSSITPFSAQDSVIGK